MCTEVQRRAGHRGFTLVETIVFMILVSVGVVALLSTMAPSLRGSVEPMQRKQMTAIAEALMNEILHQPFTYCDLDDPKGYSATSTADCTGGAAASQDVLGPTAGETRYATGPGAQFDNVGDYADPLGTNGLHTPIDDVLGNAVPGYAATVAIAQVGGTFGVPDNDALQVTVTVTHGADSFALTGYRFRYAPRY